MVPVAVASVLDMALPKACRSNAFQRPIIAPQHSAAKLIFGSRARAGDRRVVQLANQCFSHRSGSAGVQRGDGAPPLTKEQNAFAPRFFLLHHPALVPWGLAGAPACSYRFCARGAEGASANGTAR